jgi:hypothetical protein
MANPAAITAALILRPVCVIVFARPVIDRSLLYLRVDRDGFDGKQCSR